MDGKYLSEVIDINRDIMPYRLIQIYSGVGSGKNTWVEKLAEDGYSILLITSRRATANAQASKLKAFRYYGFKDFPLDKKRLKQSIVVCTNSSLATFITNEYDLQKPKTHIWEHFDFIILDEAHSLVTDATFLDAPFHVKCFLRWVQDNDEHCKLIFMTGTPEPLDSLVSNRTKQSNTYKYLDYYEKCRHVDPEEVILYPKEHVASEIKKQLSKNPDERIIYFANRINHIKTLVTELKEQGIPEEDIGIAYSDKSKDAEFSDTLVAKKERIKNSIIEQECIPSDVRIFITTTQNKEGINLNDDDIKIMFAESTQRAELIQMAGRVRKGLDYLAILYDTEPYISYITEFEAILDKRCCKTVNAVLDEFVESSYMPPNNDGKGLIANVEKSFPNIRFDYMTYTFLTYTGRIEGNRQVRDNSCYVKECVRTWCRETPESAETGKGQGALNMQEWFPFSECSTLYTARTDVDQLALFKNEVNKYLKIGNYIGTTISLEQCNIIRKDLNKFIIEYKPKALGTTRQYKNLGTLLKKLGYSFSAVGKHDGKNWLISVLSTDA